VRQRVRTHRDEIRSCRAIRVDGTARFAVAACAKTSSCGWN